MINFLHRESTWFDHVKTKEEANYFTHKLFTYGDYAGSCVERANVNVLQEKELYSRLGIEELQEGYGSTCILFPIACLDDSEFKEMLEDLERYPCLDEDELCEVESKMKAKDWEDFGRYEFEQFIQRNGLLSIDEENQDVIELTDQQLDSIFHAVESQGNYDLWVCENGKNGFFNFKSFGGLGQKAIKLLKNEIKTQRERKY